MKLEREVEAYLVECVKALGGEAYKFTSPQRRNVPDRLIVVADVEVFFVECKRPGEHPTEGQKREHERLMQKGKMVMVVDSRESVHDVIKYITRARYNHKEKQKRGLFG